MSTRQHPPFFNRLLVRIYLVGITQLLLVGFSFELAHRYLMEAPLRHGDERMATYFVADLAPLRGQPEALRNSLARVKRRMRMDVTLRTPDGTLLATNMDKPLPALGPEQLEQLMQRRVFSLPEESHSMAIAMPETGPLEAYALVKRPPPPGPPPNFWPLFVLSLGCTAITSIVFARSLAVPLQKLASTARAFGGGKLNARSGVRRRDELGQVAVAFDEMAERITLLLRSQKELLANVSHELRTPLSRIRVALDLANEGDATLARESLADIAEDLSELERLVEDVLTTARLDLLTGQTPGATPPLRREHVEAQLLVDKAAARFRNARPEHRLEVNVDGPLPVLEVDPVLLRRALDNLLDNAGKYSDPSSTVRLNVRRYDQGLELEVSDEGIGIDAQDIPHLFTPFFRSDRSRARRTGGVGLGLALARRIAVAHGGWLSIESQPGVGTQARITLPLTPSAVAAEDGPPAASG